MLFKGDVAVYKDAQVLVCSYMQEWLTIQEEGLREWRQSKGHVLGLAGVNFEAEGRTLMVEGA